MSERTIAISCLDRRFLLTWRYPAPDDIVDWTSENKYDCSKPHATMLDIVYEYNGHFWQGLLGRLHIASKTISRKSNLPAWDSLDSLSRSLIIERADWVARNQANSNDPPLQYHDPILFTLNDIPCLQQYIPRVEDTKAECQYYFLLDTDHALRISVIFADNNIPGQPQSDWRSRAEALASSILSSINIQQE